MTTQRPIFNPRQWELRQYTNPYLSPEQKSKVTEVEGRVEGQLNWVAQALGWNGPNYWGNLPDTVDQKRQVLGGTFGVYNSFIVADVYEVRNWNNTIVIEPVENLEAGSEVFIGLDSFIIQSLTLEDGRYVLGFSELTEDFISNLNSNLPLRLSVEKSRPAPFYRPKVGTAGDTSFLVKAVGSTLELYPAYDTGLTLPYKFDNLIAGSTYYFNQSVFLSYSTTFSEDVPSFYDSDKKLWYLTVPEALSVTQTDPTAFLVWNYSDPAVQTNVVKQVTVRQWHDPSDWITPSVLKNFTGAWGNKGGALPFNLLFDSLGVHGYSERDSLYLGEVNRSIDFNQLLSFVYAERASVSVLPPSAPKEGDLWWNSETGALAVWYDYLGDCSSWVEVTYREQPVVPTTIPLTFPDVAAFQAAAPTVLSNTVVKVLDSSGLSVSDGIIGLQGTLTGSGSITLYKQATSVYWVPMEFMYPDENSFDADALFLPYKIPVTVIDGSGISPSVSVKASTTAGSPNIVLRSQNRKISPGMTVSGVNVPVGTTVVSVDAITITLSNNLTTSGTNEVLRFYTNGLNYDVTNLSVSITQNVTAVLLKLYTNTSWVIEPDSVLKYIANTSLYGSPLQGELWWDYSNPDDQTRAAAIYTGSSWIAVNYHPQGSVPPGALDYSTLFVYCDGVLLNSGVAYSTSDYEFIYTVNSATGQFDFSYSPLSPKGKLRLPSITISDILTTAYTQDISDLVFSGIQYYFSPNVYNCETPLRVWKTKDLQVVDNLSDLELDTFANPLRADTNTGPGPENWQRFFLRLPPEYSRNETNWQKTNLICQDFAYWGSSILAELMQCPPELQEPEVYEELFLYEDDVNIDRYVYSEPYLYSNVGFFNYTQVGEYTNSGVFPVFEFAFDEFTEGNLVDYDPLHCRQADTTSPVGAGFGDWEGIYLTTQTCRTVTGFLSNDLETGIVEELPPPVWDASVYKFPPTCDTNPDTYTADANNYKVCYAYFSADLSAAEDGFFDVQQEAAWRYPVTQPKTGYLLPG
jgi:hypothetical protein